MSEEVEAGALPGEGEGEAREAANANASADAPAAATVTGPAALPGAEGAASLGSLVDVPLELTVEVGSARMLVREVLQLNKGSVVALDRMVGEPADILVNGRRVARGEVTTLDDSLAVRVVELVGSGPSARER